MSNSGSNTEQLSAFVDHFAKPEVKNLKSFVEDTPDILRQFQKENQECQQPPNAMPVTIDVSSLYTNIPIEGEMGGLEAFTRCMDSRADKKVPTWFLEKALKTVLQGNIFEFNNQLWSQEIGTAMGTKCAPSYANIFMGYLEEEVLMKNWEGTMPHMWRRYIDDIFFIWKSSTEELEEFLNHLNKQHQFIKFTVTYDAETKTIPFLDMSVKIENGQIVTDLYTKPTARNQYLMPSSCHPLHITKNIPYSLAYRILRICTYRESFKNHLEALRQNLIVREYHPKIIEEAFQKICQIPREEALKKVKRTENNRQVLAVHYHPGLPSVTKTVRKHHKVMVNQSNRMKDCFRKLSLVAYKRNKNLGEILIRAKVPFFFLADLPIKRSARKKVGFTLCGRLCYACIQCKKATFHKCKRTGKSWRITSSLN